ncbi:hypothetical protein SAMN04487958_107180 [Vreelandella subterranea]|uniref:Uncharacterized protein n=1 Tax=Vreelandella subterranea TaxID=416874 RepID=A0A1H9USM3_9GAMM|nr:hypothetical protein [Halomonas subterranea]SES12124.1 hypothetical protein SAMN04487958_107180 [Halomonas subterranea]
MTDKAKGGLQARRAAMLCQNSRFGLYLDQRRRQANDLDRSDLPDGTHTPSDCTDWLRHACGINSRAELDHNDDARAMLDKIMADYNKWERQQRLNDRIAGGVV